MLLDLNNLSYAYPGAVPALSGISLTVRPGEFVGIMGRTGCGKSTLLQLIAGLLSPTEGQILLEGQDIHAPDFDRMILRNTVGMVFQFPENQLFETTVERDVAFGLRHRGLSSEEISDRVRRALRQVGFVFEQIRWQSPLALSGGEKRRVAIAGVLAAKPRLLLLDEPVAGLDPEARGDFLRLLRDLNEQGVTVLMVSHNADALAACAGRLVVLEEGRILMDGATAEVMESILAQPQLRLGVSVPCAIAGLLRQRGISLPDGIVTSEALSQALLALHRGGAVP